VTFRVDRHYWWTADRSKLVPTGHPSAAFLAFTAGSEIPDAEAHRAGLLTGPVVSPGETPAEKMRAAKLANKVGPRPSTKAETPDEETL
jgi:hypothetical protein